MEASPVGADGPHDSSPQYVQVPGHAFCSSICIMEALRVPAIPVPLILAFVIVVAVLVSVPIIP